ncbi:MAG: DUF2330 domain-containing protein [Polyangiaceae bacterium]|nr:DUF2330 domain-containing protein [Polyangiaceae bacterium]
MKQLSSASKILLGATAATIIFSSSTAGACGGFFCSAATPVNQAAERIIFAQDDAAVTQIVEVQYEGEAENFAWILPVPGTPDVNVSSQIVFDRLQLASNPSYQLIQDFGRCSVSASSSGGTSGLDSRSESEGTADRPPSVQVVDSGSVGPYDYETISLNPDLERPALAALNWLEENGYDISGQTEDVLGPYLENGLNLIAFRLQKGVSSGAIRPIRLDIEGARRPAIPIRPTAVAANDDMGVMVWVLGNARAIPSNYRGLELNEALIDWFNPNTSYNAVVTAAANEAGGQGFVTEMSGPAAPFEGQIFQTWNDDTSSLLEIAGMDLETALRSLINNYSDYDGFREVLTAHVPLREGITTDEFLSCIDCYFDPGRLSFVDGFGGAGQLDEISPDDPIYSTNISVVLEGIKDDVLKPIRDTADLFAAYEQVTRFYTTMSSEEMTLDPVFDFNPDLEDVSNIHQATQSIGCDGPGGDWKVTLESGQEVYGTGNTWPLSLEARDEMPVNRRVLQFATAGAPEIITDNQAAIGSALASSQEALDQEELETGETDNAGSGCSLSRPQLALGSWPFFAGLLSAALFFWRRRRSIEPELS